MLTTDNSKTLKFVDGYLKYINSLDNKDSIVMTKAYCDMQKVLIKLKVLLEHDIKSQK